MLTVVSFTSLVLNSVTKCTASSQSTATPIMSGYPVYPQNIFAVKAFILDFVLEKILFLYKILFIYCSTQFG